MKPKPVIFVVEDNLIVQELLEHSLKEEINCYVSNYSTARHALNEIVLVRPDLILLDYSFGGAEANEENGMFFMRELKRKKMVMPVIIFSGQSNKLVMNKLFRIGAIDYISKDQESFLDELILSVRKALGFSDNRKIFLGEILNQSKS
jgi:DNA-binding NtrC family response regulator